MRNGILLYIGLAWAVVLCLAAPSAIWAQQDPANAADEREIRTLVISVGSQEIITAPGARYVAENTDVITVRTDPERRLITVSGRAPGTSELDVIHPDGSQVKYRITVVSDEAGAYEELRQLLLSIPGVSLHQVGSRLVTRGTIHTQADKRNYDNVMRLFPGVIDNVRFDPVTIDVERIISEINEDLGRNNLGTMHVYVRDTTGDDVQVVLAGWTRTEDSRSRAERIANGRISGTDLVSLVVVDDPEITVHTMIVTLDDSKIDGIGNNELFDLLTQGGALGGPGGFLEVPGGVIGGGGRSSAGLLRLGYAPGTVDLSLRALQTLTYVTSAWQSSLVTKSGGEAEFHDGGRIVVALTGGERGDSGEIHTINTGTILRVMPTLLDNGMIDLNVEVEVTMTGGSEAAFVGDAEVSTLALRTFRTDSGLTIEDGETIVVSGLNADMFRQSEGRTPFLHRIPVVNLFFNRKDRGSENMQSLFIVTPTLRTTRYTDPDHRGPTDVTPDQVEQRRRDALRRDTGIGFWTGFESGVPDPPTPREDTSVEE